ncbi:PepSY domain-containing protein [Pigmentiphaga sp. H8]|uniref:PepSY domain-containing protein n=1 Tax=Pigmentiphaga sp. H8 TaxID=2488560 RepID=UPI000F5AE360|nr:PepSY domain-containing protein [Pigmentiphaga sp. H8]AZG08953.1 PepSY domain-containing protein [Pigmentiphaga sp. H8]
MRTRLKRWLYLLHRWLGIVMCAFFVMWFASGVVMMYVGYPKLTAAERLQHLPALDPAAPLLGPAQALAAAGIDSTPKNLRLSAASAGRPVYLATLADGSRAGAPVAIDAATGTLLRAIDTEHAVASAAAYAGGAVQARYAGLVDEDAHTHSRALDPHRPLHRVQLDDEAGTLLYVSSHTGEVVRDATRTERAWNYAGAWIHWLYPFRGNFFDRHWAAIVDGLSIAGIAVALTGTIVGLLRWRFARPYRSGSRSPYRAGMMRWHHLAGLAFALTTLTWIFSGLMSMNPWGLFSSGRGGPSVAAVYGDTDAMPAGAAPVQALLAGGNVRELRWVHRLGHELVLAYGPAGRLALLDARTAQAVNLDPDELRRAATELMPAPVARIQRLDRYDLHYYDRAPHTMTGGGDKPLPVWRIEFDDPAATWVHLDPYTGSILNSTDRPRRASRWLFAMLHSWDWLPLLERRPLWDAVLILFSLGGIALSATGLVIGWRRLRLSGHRFRA